MAALLDRIVRGLCGGLRAVWRIIAAPGTLSIREETDSGASALAAGDVFRFQASLALDWRSTGLTEGELKGAINLFRGAARARMGEVLARRAHRYEPTCGFDLEQELNAELADDEFSFQFRGRPVYCLAQVRVALDQDIRTALRGPLLDRMVMEITHDNGMRKAVLVDERANTWSKVLAKLHDDPLIASAARMTDEEFATVVEKLTDGVSEELAELRKLLTRVMEGPPQRGEYEWARSIDQTLRALSRRIGPDEPPLAG